jgi:hypothetical protein
MTSPLSFQGVGGSSVVCNEGSHPLLGVIHIVPECPMDLANFVRLRLLYHITYSDYEPEFVCYPRDKSLNTYPLVFICNSEGMFMYSHVQTQLNSRGPPEPRFAAASVAMPCLMPEPGPWSPHQLAMAHAARALHENMCHPTDAVLCRALRAGQVMDTLVDPHAVHLSTRVLGSCPSCVVGKQRRYQTTELTSESISSPASHVGEHLYWDILFCGKRKLLFSVDGKSGHKLSAILQSGSARDLLPVAQRMVAYYLARQCQPVAIHSDYERAFGTFVESVLHLQWLFSPAGHHCRRAESGARTIRARQRTIVNSLVYKLPQFLTCHLVQYIVVMLNLVPNSNTGMETPYTMLNPGSKPSAKTSFRLKFGDLVSCISPTNDASRAGDECIYLFPMVGRPLAYVYSFHHGRNRRHDGFVYRDNAKRHMIKIVPSEHIRSHLASLVTEHGAYTEYDEVYLDSFVVEPGEARVARFRQEVASIPEQPLSTASASAPQSTAVDELDNPTLHTPVPTPVPVPPVHEYPPLRPSPSPERVAPSAGDPLPLIPAEGAPQWQDDSAPTDIPTPAHAQERVVTFDIPTPDIHTDVNAGVSREPELYTNPSQHDRGTLRSRVTRSGRQYDMDKGHKAMCLQVLSESRQQLQTTLSSFDRYTHVRHHVYPVSFSLKTAMNRDATQAASAIDSELHNLYPTAFDPVAYDSLSPAQRKSLLYTFMFFVDKFHADGLFEKLKARLVVIGSQQNRYDINIDPTSPTVDFLTVSLVLNLVCVHGMHCAVVDVKAAFLQADILEDIYIVINAELAAMFIALFPEHSTKRRADGSIICKLKKAMYGLIQASKLWFLHVRKILEDEGFICCNLDDSCLFFRTDPVTGTHHYVLVHVDDFLLTASSEALLEQLLARFHIAFPSGLVVQRGPRFSYLGMTLAQSPDRTSISASQRGYLQALLKKEGVTGVVANASPIDVLSPPTIEESAPADKTWFASCLMSLAFVSNRTRPDLKFPISFLASQMSAPNLKAARCLRHLLQYVNRTIDYYIRFSPTSTEIYCEFDGSFALYPDGRGQSGILIEMGKGCGPMYIQSTKQRLLGNCSTANELLCADDGLYTLHKIHSLLDVLHQRSTKITTVMQDNESALKIIRAGPEHHTKRTKYLNIRINHLYEAEVDSEVMYAYLQTEKMRPDLLNKFLHGEPLHRHTMDLLNMPR